MKTILVTGGAGYIGSHTCVELLKAGYEVIVYDNLQNSTPGVLDRVAEIANANLTFVAGSVLDRRALKGVFHTYKIDGVIHFAGLKSVSESVQRPIDYYNVNVTGTLNLLNLMEAYKVRNFVFSSSATVYGKPTFVPVPETAPINPINPYGRTKAMVEQIVQDWYAADTRRSVALLRYFNPIGAHVSGMIGEDPGTPNNLMPFIAQVATKQREKVFVFGNDYATPDGTCVRDYIHVSDLAEGHVATLRKLEEEWGMYTYNLGTGTGSSVFEVIRAFEKASDESIPYVIAPRRPGDIAFYYADSSKAESELGWKAKRNLATMCEDTWRWQRGRNLNLYFL